MWGSEEGRGRRSGSSRSLTLAAESNTQYVTLYNIIHRSKGYAPPIIRFVAEYKAVFPAALIYCKGEWKPSNQDKTG